MRVVVADLKVLCTEVIDTLHLSQDLQLGERPDLPLKLHIQTDGLVLSLKSIMENMETRRHVFT